MNAPEKRGLQLCSKRRLNSVPNLDAETTRLPEPITAPARVACFN